MEALPIHLHTCSHRGYISAVCHRQFGFLPAGMPSQPHAASSMHCTVKSWSTHLSCSGEVAGSEDFGGLVGGSLLEPSLEPEASLPGRAFAPFPGNGFGFGVAVARENIKGMVNRREK